MKLLLSVLPLRKAYVDIIRGASIISAQEKHHICGTTRAICLVKLTTMNHHQPYRVSCAIMFVNRVIISKCTKLPHLHDVMTLSSTPQPHQPLPTHEISQARLSPNQTMTARPTDRSPADQTLTHPSPPFLRRVRVP